MTDSFRFPQNTHTRIRARRLRTVFNSRTQGSLILTGRLPAFRLPDLISQLPGLIRQSKALIELAADTLILRHRDVLLTHRVHNGKGISVLLHDVMILIIAAARRIVVFRHTALLLALSLAGAQAEARQKVICPDGYSWTVTGHKPFAGSVLPCEQFDLFFRLLETGRTDEAAALLTVRHGSATGKVPKDFRREAEPVCEQPDDYAGSIL